MLQTTAWINLTNGEQKKQKTKEKNIVIPFI